MSFTAMLMKTTSDPATLIKSFDVEFSYPVSSITPTESCDILSPTFILNYDAKYSNCNYISVGAPFNRSYFITDMKIDIGKKIVINCSVDVLETYFNEILEIQGYIVRTGHAASMNRFLSDNNIPIKTKTITDNFPFDKTPFTVYDKGNAMAGITKNYLLTVIGGAAAAQGDDNQ